MNTLTQIVTALVALVGAATSIFLAIERWQNRHTPVKELEIREDEAIDSRWRGLIEAQVRDVIEPMRERMAEQDRRITEQGAEIRELRTEVGVIRTRYWKAIQYIRTLHTWIARHMPADVRPPPDIPTDLAEDV